MFESFQSKFDQLPVVKKSRRVYEKLERFVPVISFFAGFVWDSLTLTRIDLWLDNVIISAYILLIGLLIILVNLISDGIIQSAIITRYKDWYVAAMQFLFGGVFSSYVVYYFRSADISSNWFFLLILIALFIGNEFLKERLVGLRLQMAMYMFASLSFFIFFIPVLLKHMNTWVFLLSGLLGFGYVIGLIYLLVRIDRQKSMADFKSISGMMLAILIVFNLFYFLNIIPPVPLALKEGGIYHNVKRINGAYSLTFEKGSWYKFWKKSDDVFHFAEGDTVYCYASIFAPTQLHKQIYHDWQYYDENRDEWVSLNRLSYRIVGGRDGGYRGFTYKRTLRPGDWRVDVETAENQRLSRMCFSIVPDDGAGRVLKTILR